MCGDPRTERCRRHRPRFLDLDATAACRNVQTGLSQWATTPTWTPVWRDERSYTVSTNLTKVRGQATSSARASTSSACARTTGSPKSSNPRGTLTFSGGVTGTPGYAGVGGWNSYAAFLLGEMSSYRQERPVRRAERPRKSVRRVHRRSLAGERQADAESRPAIRVYPLMSRQNRGIELLDYDTFNVRLGGLGGNPKDLGLKVEQDAVRSAPGRGLPAQRPDGLPRRLRQTSTRCHGRARCAAFPADDCL